jgi:hypothetical protein
METEPSFLVRQVIDLYSVSRDTGLHWARIASDNVANARKLRDDAKGTPHAGPAALELQRAQQVANISAMKNRKKFRIVD